MISDTIKITVLVENTVSRQNLKAEHGLSFWVETAEGNILWDTGQTVLLLENAQKLGIPLYSTNYIVLSHGHYDHTGGLLQVLLRAPHAQVYGHPDLFVQRFTRTHNTVYSIKPVGSPVLEDFVKKRCGSLNLSSGPVSILPGIFTTGEIPRKTEYEDTGGEFFRDISCSVRDFIHDDQALCIVSSHGLVVILGCAHSGVVNTLNLISELTGQSKIYAVLGGMHLLRASQKRLDATAKALVHYDVRMIGPCHCTGLEAQTYLMSCFPDRFVECSTGACFSF
ncbi:MBL fold metallo-hydrolase [Candidatus Latescibacterota bacterium]